jgi:hypothetical protein
VRMQRELAECEIAERTVRDSWHSSTWAGCFESSVTTTWPLP